jgi:hypothetical protein
MIIMDHNQVDQDNIFLMRIKKSLPHFNWDRNLIILNWVMIGDGHVRQVKNKVR